MQIAGGEGPRIGGGMQLRRHLPVRGRIERHADGPLLEAARPHQRRRNIDVRVSRIDAEIRAVDLIAEHLVADAHRAAVAADVPLARIRTLDRQRRAGAVVHLDVVDVPCELVNGVSAGRRPRHHDLERARRHLGERDLDLHPMMLRLGKADAIGHGRLRERRAARTSSAMTMTRDLIPNP